MPDTQTILTIIFCVVDDLVKQHGLYVKPGACPRFTDSEIIALVLYKELAGVESERQLLRLIKRDYLHLFPELVGQSQFNRRARYLAWRIERVRQDVLAKLDAHLVEFNVIDSTAVPMKHLIRAYLLRSEVNDITGYGNRHSHREYYYGTKLHIIINRYGVPTTACVTHPSVSDGVMLKQMLEDRSNLVVLGDKAYCSNPLKRELLDEQSILLVSARRANQKEQNTPEEKLLLRRARLLIESVLNMLKSHLMLNRILAKTQEGLVARIHRKLTAFVLGIYINRMLDRPGLAIKSLAA